MMRAVNLWAHDDDDLPAKNHVRRTKRASGVRRAAERAPVPPCGHWTVNLSRTRGGAKGWVSVVPEKNVIGDAGAVVQELPTICRA